MMGTGVSRMNSGPTLTRSLSSDNVAGSFAQHASRSYTDSRRNSLGLSSSTSGPLAARRVSGATTHGGTVPRTVSSSSTVSSVTRSLDTSAVCRPSSSTLRSGHPSTTVPAASSRSSAASAGRSDGRQGSGRQQKQRRPNERQRPVEIRQTLKLDDEALFSEEELAAFRCAGMAAESEAAIGVQLPEESAIGSIAIAAEVAPPVVIEIVDHETGVVKTPPRDTRKKRIVTGEETKAEMPQRDDKLEKDREQNFEEECKGQQQHQEGNSHKDEPLLRTAQAAAAVPVRGSRVHDERKATEDSVARKLNAAGGGGHAAGAAQHGLEPGAAAQATPPQSAEKKGGRLLRTLSASVSMLKRAFMGSASFSATSPSASAFSPSPAAAAKAAAANALAGHAKREAASRASAWTSGKPSALAATHGTNGSSSSSVASGASGTTGTSGTSRTEGTSWTSGTNGTSGTSGSATGGGATSASGVPNLVTPTRTLHPINTPSAFNPAPSPLAADISPRALFHSTAATAATGFSAVVSASRAPLSASTAPSTPQYGLPRTAQGSTSATASPHSGAFVPVPWDTFGSSSVPASPAASEGAGGGVQSRRKRWASIGGGQERGSFLVLGGMSADRVGGTSRGEAGEGAEDGFTRYGMKKQELDSATSSRMGYTSDGTEDSRRKSDRQGRATWSATPGDATPMQIRQMMNAQERKARTNGVGKSTSKGKGRSDRTVHPELSQATPASPSAPPPVNHSGGRRQGSARVVGRGAAAAAAAAAGVGRSPGKGGKGSGEDVADDVAAAVRAWARERRGGVLVSGHGGEDVPRQEKMVGVERWLQQRLMDGYSGSEGIKSSAWELRSGSADEGTESSDADAAAAGAGEGKKGTGARKEPGEGRARWEVTEGAVHEGDSEKKVRREAVGGEDSGNAKKKVSTGSGRVKKKISAGASAGEEEAAGGETVKGKKSNGGSGVKDSGDAYEHSDKENGVKKVKSKGVGNGKGKQKGQGAQGVGKASGDEAGSEDGAGGVGAAMSERVGGDANGKAIEKRKKKVVKKASDSVGDDARDGGEVKRGVKNGATMKKGKKAPPGSKKSDGSGDKGDVSDGEGVGGVKVKKVGKKKRPVSSDRILADQGLLQPNPDRAVSEEKVAHGSSLELAIQGK
ncbi:unnamed protein product [Closterium sp. Yama58-4]|nr:unnamed protein product [Closterium sp. Yama58-4]